MAALDIKEKQILVRYEADDNFTWHHRVLLERGDAQTWVVLTPSLEVQVLNVAEIQFIALVRGRPAPRHAADDCFLFDPLSARELADAHAEARQLAEILGERAAPDVTEVWVVADIHSEKFGELVDDSIIQEVTRATLFETRGVALLDPDDPSTEVFIERVPRAELDEWKRRKGGGGDLRLLGTHRAPSGRRYLSPKEGIEAMEESKFDDFPFAEPRAAREYLQSLVEATDAQFDVYHQEWLSASGVSPSSSVAHDHKILLEALRLGISYDQFNLANSAMAEQVVRRLIQHELATERDAKHPDYGGLSSLTTSTTEDKGRVRVPRFQKALSESQQERAQILKQARLLREEKASEQRRRKGKSKGKGKDASAEDAS